MQVAHKERHFVLVDKDDNINGEITSEMVELMVHITNESAMPMCVQFSVNNFWRLTGEIARNVVSMKRLCQDFRREWMSSNRCNSWRHLMREQQAM